MKNLNTEFYTKSFDNYGISAKGVHWDSKESQYKRFEVITSFLDKIEKSSIIDIGCGYGEYLNYLNSSNIKPDIYLGIDIERFMIDICSKRFPKNIFIKCDILTNKIPEADYLFCSGALNILAKNDFLQAIKNCFKSSKKGFCFNFLTKNSIHTLKTPEIINFCKTLTKKVSIKDDYLNNDITVLLEK